MGSIPAAESRSYKSAPVRTDYRGRVNIRGARVNVTQEQNVPHTPYTGKNLHTPKRHVVSGKPATFGVSGRFAPGAFTRGMGYADNAGYFESSQEYQLPEFDTSTLDGARAARDYTLTLARAAETAGNSVAAENLRSNARDFRAIVRRLERGNK
jgi:hypothetical protein